MKRKISLTLESELVFKLHQIAKKHFQGNISKAFEHMTWSALDKQHYLRFMAKHHAAMFKHFKDTLDAHTKLHEDVIQDVIA